MNILGLMGGTRVGYQDASAALLKNGKLISFVEEERVGRVKHAPGTLPERAIRFILNNENISIRDVDYVVSHGITWEPDFRKSLREFFYSKFGDCPKNIELVYHHDAHCASAYYASGFNEAMIFSADYSGDGISTQLATGLNGKIMIKQTIERPNSLGIFYALMTEYCGFLKDNDEYKVMGLSSYGDKEKFDFSWLLEINDGIYQLNTEYIKGHKPGEPGVTKQIPVYNQQLIKKLGPPRGPGDPMTEYYKNIAASAQKHLENVIVSIITKFHKDTGLRKLCLAGGVALNVVVNQKLMNLDFIDEIYIQPAANDAGISLGAAYIIASQLGEDIDALPHVYYGPGYSNNEIEAALKMANVNYVRIDDVASYAAQKVATNNVVGWFQGKMEFGPRALGNRSILANPTNREMQDIVNTKIKFREEFRPFCPSVIEEEAMLYVKGKSKVSPYMTITYDVKENYIGKLPSVTHVDNSTRIQTVNHEQNLLYYNYLCELKKHIGIGVTLNTSFNVKGDPIVNTPFQALATFYGSGMDTLIIGNFVINKK
jgi:carbamoyltransferase